MIAGQRPLPTVSRTFTRTRLAILADALGEAVPDVSPA
jgi:hypothetical protein